MAIQPPGRGSSIPSGPSEDIRAIVNELRAAIREYSRQTQNLLNHPDVADSPTGLSEMANAILDLNSRSLRRIGG